MTASTPAVEFRRNTSVATVLRSIGEWELVVGVVGPGAAEIEDGSSLTLAELATIQEFGSSVAPGTRGHVPERSFIRSTIAARRGEIASLTASEMKAVLAGTRTVPQALDVIGAQVAAWIKSAVMSGAGIPPPLAPSTIARKGSSRPLVDHGQMIAHGVSYIVRKRGS